MLLLLYFRRGCARFGRLSCVNIRAADKKQKDITEIQGVRERERNPSSHYTPK
jgi:hypothetical protein